MPNSSELSRRERQIMDAVFALGEATVNKIWESIPAHLREPMKKAFNVAGGPVQEPAKPTGAATPAEAIKLLDDVAYYATAPIAVRVAKAKVFEVTFAEPGNEEKACFAPRFRQLPPGKYQLRCRWMDAHQTVSKPGDWTGELAAPELDFTLARFR